MASGLAPAAEVTVTVLELGDILELAQLTWANREHIAQGFVTPPEAGARLVGQLTGALASHISGRSWQGVIRVDGRIAGRVWVVAISGLGPQTRCLLDPRASAAELHEVMCWVAADRCGIGAGRSAVAQAVTRSAQSVGAAPLFARIARDNSASLAAFRAAGFRQVGPWRDSRGYWLATSGGIDGAL